jgi:hypothetical protein
MVYMTIPADPVSLPFSHYHPSLPLLALPSNNPTLLAFPPFSALACNAFWYSWTALVTAQVRAKGGATAVRKKCSDSDDVMMLKNVQRRYLKNVQKMSEGDVQRMTMFKT